MFSIIPKSLRWFSDVSDGSWGFLNDRERFGTFAKVFKFSQKYSTFSKVPKILRRLLNFCEGLLTFTKVFKDPTDSWTFSNDHECLQSFPKVFEGLQWLENVRESFDTHTTYTTHKDTLKNGCVAPYYVMNIILAAKKLWR